MGLFVSVRHPALRGPKEAFANRLAAGRRPAAPFLLIEGGRKDASLAAIPTELAADMAAKASGVDTRLSGGAKLTRDDLLPCRLFQYVLLRLVDS